MILRFSYLELKGQHFPVADVELRGQKTSLVVKTLVDSGATYSIFREEIAETLGIVIERGRPVYLEGVGGRILGYLHRIPVMVGKKRFMGKIVFSREFRVSVNIMGRDNFFRHFWITFKESSRKLEFLPPQ